MPAVVPWSVRSGYGRVHPVEVYRLVAALTVCGFLLAALRLRPREGRAAWWGFLLGGVALVVVDFFRLPDELFSAAWLDRVQWAGVAMIAVGGGMLVVGAAGAASEVGRGAGDAF